MNDIMELTKLADEINSAFNPWSRELATEIQKGNHMVNMHVVVLSNGNPVTVPEDLAKEFEEAYQVLKRLPASRAISTEPFPDAEAALQFVRQGKEWAKTHEGPNERPLVFGRRGNIQEEPLVVTFRIYERPAPRNK